MLNLKYTKLCVFLGLFIKVGLVGKSNWRRESRGPSVNKLICHVKEFRLDAIDRAQRGAVAASKWGVPGLRGGLAVVSAAP